MPRFLFNQLQARDILRLLRLFAANPQLLAGAGCVLLALLVGCGGRGAQTSARLPTLSEIAAPVSPYDDARPELPTPNASVLIARTELSLDASTRDAWQFIDEAAIPAAVRAVWQANGFRVGLLPLSQIEALNDRLPPIFDTQTTAMRGSPHPLPILRTPPLAGRVDLDLTLPPAPPTLQPIDRGRLQLLLRTAPAGGGQTLVELIPHQYLPRTTLIPRSPLAKELDGELFERIALAVPLGPDELLVLGLLPARQPPPPPAPAPEAEPEPEVEVEPEGEAGEAEEGPAYDELFAPEESGTSSTLRLADLLLRQQRLRDRIQLLLLIRVVPMDAPNDHGGRGDAETRREPTEGG